MQSIVVVQRAMHSPSEVAASCYSHQFSLTIWRVVLLTCDYTRNLFSNLQTTMHFTNSIKIAAPAASVYELCTNVSKWPSWDPEVEKANISSPFAKGAVGTLKPKGGPEAKIELVEVAFEKSFTVRCKLPLCEMTFGHVLAESGSFTTATHSVAFTGLMSSVFGFLIGRGIKKTLPATLDGLKRAAELSVVDKQ